MAMGARKEGRGGRWSGWDGLLHGRLTPQLAMRIDRRLLPLLCSPLVHAGRRCSIRIRSDTECS